jgi:dolichol-phosphate mannosyltransferase
VAELAAADPRVHLLHRTTDRGRGRAGAAAFAWALERGYDLVFEMDADFSHHPRHLPAMIAALEHADVVLGSRQVPGGQDIGRPAWRVWLTRASNLYVRLVLGVPVRDCNSGYRGFRRGALAAIDAGRAFSPGPAIVHELLYKARRKRLAMAEIPIRFVEREQGTSTLTFRTLVRSYVTILRLRWLGLTGGLFEARA